MKRIFVTSIVSTVAVGAPGDATLSRGVRDCAYIYVCVYISSLAPRIYSRGIFD